MADGKREHDHDLMVCLTCHISKMLTGEFKPEDANPYTEKLPKRQLTEEERKELNKCGLMALKQGLIGLYGNRLKKKKKTL